jgi:hypothetical protein
MKRYNDLLNCYNVSANRYNDSETVQTGTRVRVRVRAAGIMGFFQKETDRSFSNPYPFTRLYSGMGTGTAGTGHGYTGTGCTRRILANP